MKKILHRICTKNRVKALRFLKKMFPLNQFIEMLNQSNKTDQRPIEYTVRYAAIALVRILFEIPEIRDIYYNNNTNLCRLLYHLFRYNRNPHLIDYILKILKISTEKFTELLNHKIEAPPKGTFPGLLSLSFYIVDLVQIQMMSNKYFLSQTQFLMTRGN